MIEQKYGWIYGLQSPKGKWYIGQTTQEPYSYIQHNYGDEYGNKRFASRRRPKLERAINKYGFQNFKVVILCSKDTKEELDNAEIFYIKEFSCLGHSGYNCKEGGSSGKLSKETKKKISVARKKFFANGGVSHWKGKKQTEIAKKRISETRTRLISEGKIVPSHTPVTEETKKLLSDKFKGKHHSPNTEFKKGMKPWNTGKKLPEISGMNNSRAKLVSILDTKTGKIHTGCLSQIAKELGFYASAICTWGHTKGFRLINKDEMKQIELELNQPVHV
jgi:group I intron endonuclease